MKDRLHLFVIVTLLEISLSALYQKRRKEMLDALP